VSFAGGGVESGIEEVAILLGRLLLILSKLNLWGVLLIMFYFTRKARFHVICRYLHSHTWITLINIIYITSSKIQTMNA
jgi:hypothetical protein